MTYLTFLLVVVALMVVWGRLRSAEAALAELRKRLGRLEEQAVLISARRASTEPARPATPPSEAPATAPPEPAASGEPAHSPASSTEPASAPRPAPSPSPEPAPGVRPTAAAAVPDVAPLAPVAGRIDELIAGLRAWLVGGNTVVRVGVVVLFFGVVFFLSYAIDQGWLPVEIRLVLAAAGGAALTGVGWRARESRRDYALVLQGGGVGIIYLTVFAAASLYGVMSPAPALLLMVVLVALACALAILQDARSLAVLATLGGFLAPLVQGEGGSDVALFAYYAVLDVGILGIAWFKAWRGLNLLGAMGTFGLTALLSPLSYRPERFATTEPFLVFYFLLYVAVPVLFARRQRVAGLPYVDGSLLFGVPLVAFGLQAQLVSNLEYGLAFSALGAGVFYVGLASALWRRLPEAARMLVESLLALGVAFGTLAIPMALDGRVTGAAWALEGAGLVWIGVRQSRLLARLSGLLLQGAAGIAFLTASPAPGASVPVLNSVFVGALLVSLSGFFVAWYLDRHREGLRSREGEAAGWVLAWALVWWVGAGLHEISAWAPEIHHTNGYLVFATGSALLLTVLRRNLDWEQLRVPVLLLLPAMVLIGVRSFGPVFHPLAGWGMLAWSVAFAGHLWMQRRLESEWPARVAEYWHRGMLWLAVFLASWEAFWLVGRLLGRGTVWSAMPWLLVPGVTIVALPGLTGRIGWPFRRFAASYRAALAPLALAIGLWVLFATLARGNPAPLPYLPILNPLELAQCLGLVFLLQWARDDRRWISRRGFWLLWPILAFVVLNGVIARTAHYQTGVRLLPWTLWASPFYQTAVSIVWAAAAFVAMISATWLKRRSTWFVGAGLLGAVVVKLFLVDLDDVGTVARIVSFVVVGLLMLLVGYVSPLPPKSKEQPAS